MGVWKPCSYRKQACDQPGVASGMSVQLSGAFWPLPPAGGPVGDSVWQEWGALGAESEAAPALQAWESRRNKGPGGHVCKVTVPQTLTPVGILKTGSCFGPAVPFS